MLFSLNNLFDFFLYSVQTRHKNEAEIHLHCFFLLVICVLMKVFAWGCGSCLGCGSSETTSLRPRFVEDLSITKIIDISCGDSHCLALSHG